jgi:hypothetical protein
VVVEVHGDVDLEDAFLRRRERERERKEEREEEEREEGGEMEDVFSSFFLDFVESC